LARLANQQRFDLSLVDTMRASLFTYIDQLGSVCRAGEQCSADKFVV